MSSGRPIDGVPVGGRGGKLRKRLEGRDKAGLQGTFPDLDGPFHPLPLVEDEASERLGIEELVGEDNGPGRQIKGIAVPDETRLPERVGIEAAEKTGFRFRSDLDKRVGRKVTLEEGFDGFHHQLGENRTKAGGGVEIGMAGMADAGPPPGVVAKLWMVEEGLEALVQADGGFAGAGFQLGDEGGGGVDRLR